MKGILFQELWITTHTWLVTGLSPGFLEGMLHVSVLGGHPVGEGGMPSPA